MTVNSFNSIHFTFIYIVRNHNSSLLKVLYIVLYWNPTILQREFEQSHFITINSLRMNWLEMTAQIEVLFTHCGGVELRWRRMRVLEHIFILLMNSLKVSVGCVFNTACPHFSALPWSKVIMKPILDPSWDSDEGTPKNIALGNQQFYSTHLKKLLV